MHSQAAVINVTISLCKPSTTLQHGPPKRAPWWGSSHPKGPGYYCKAICLAHLQIKQAALKEHKHIKKTNRVSTSPVPVLVLSSSESNSEPLWVLCRFIIIFIFCIFKASAMAAVVRPAIHSRTITNTNNCVHAQNTLYLIGFSHWFQLTCVSSTVLLEISTISNLNPKRSSNLPWFALIKC